MCVRIFRERCERKFRWIPNVCTRSSNGRVFVLFGAVRGDRTTHNLRCCCQRFRAQTDAAAANEHTSSELSKTRALVGRLAMSTTAATATQLSYLAKHMRPTTRRRTCCDAEWRSIAFESLSMKSWDGDRRENTTDLLVESFVALTGEIFRCINLNRKDLTGMFNMFWYSTPLV